MAASATPDSSAASDPFPRDRFTALLRRLPRYARLAFRLGRDERLPASRRAALIAGAVYLVSPIDLVPGIIPVAGQLDDAIIVALVLRYVLRGGGPEAIREHWPGPTALLVPLERFAGATPVARGGWQRQR